MSGRVLGGLLLALGLPAGAHAACQLDAFGTITNPQDPSCRDARFQYTRDVDDDTHIALGYDVPMPVDSLTPVDGFRSYASLHARHQALASGDAARAHAVGTTLGGRDVWAYVVGDADAVTAEGQAEAAVMVNGTIHAREWQSAEAATAFYELLVESAADDGVGRYLHDNLTVVILPVHNIDGFLTTQAFPDSVAALRTQPREGRMRRKNLRHPSNGDMPIDQLLATGADNFFGVDLNRNNAQRFGLNGGSSDDPVSLVYRGAAPGSEPETAALQAAAALGPAARLRLYSDLHSFGQVYLAPMTGNTRRDALTTALAQRMRAVAGDRYRFGPDRPGSGIGSTADWAAYDFQIPAWTLELEPLTSSAQYGGTGVSHDGFILPASEVARMRTEVSSMLLLGAWRQAGPPAVSAVEIRAADDDTIAYAARWVPDGNRRTLAVSASAALEPGRDYRLWLAFDRPMRWRNPSGALADFPGQSVTRAATVVLQAPPLSATADLAVTAAEWLDTPGGAPDGYDRYRDDAVGATFTVPAAWGTGTALPLALTVRTQDFAQHALDADPATPVDWCAGHWTGYENETGAAGDSGGLDCSFSPWASDDPTATAPATVPCREAATAPPAPPPPASAPDGGGGGGSAGLSLTLLAFAILLRRRRMHAFADHRSPDTFRGRGQVRLFARKP
jgi:hypothetical protein